MYTYNTHLYTYMHTYTHIQICNKDMQYRYAIQICNKDMQYRYAIQICNTEAVRGSMAPWGSAGFRRVPQGSAGSGRQM